MTEGGVAWCEVHAHRIPEAVEAGVFEAEAPKCAQPMCDRCVERERKRAIQELDRELMRSAADADTLRQMVPAESHCDEQAKWALLTQCVRKTVAAKALELGLLAEAAKAHADAVLDGESVLKFGKHKGRTLSAVAGTDWPYLLWLAGFNLEKMEERGRAERRVAGAGTGYITSDVEAEARRIRAPVSTAKTTYATTPSSRGGRGAGAATRSCGTSDRKLTATAQLPQARSRGTTCPAGGN